MWVVVLVDEPYLAYTVCTDMDTVQACQVLDMFMLQLLKKGHEHNSDYLTCVDVCMRPYSKL